MHLLLDGELGELGVLAEATAQFCRENSLPDEVECDLNLALEELFTNVLRHGGGAGDREVAEVRLAAGVGGVRVEFRDRGAPFDPLGAAAPNLGASLADRPDGGLGIHLVKQVLQDLAYERVDGWNRFTGTRKVELND